MEIEENTFSFLHRRHDGKVTSVVFEEDSWVQALNEFVVFLKGLGYFIDKDSIQIHEKHAGLNWDGIHCSDNDNTTLDHFYRGHWNLVFKDDNKGN